MTRQVFWLPDRPQRRAFPWFPTVAALRHATFVPGYSGGPAAELHGIPLTESEPIIFPP